MGLETAIVAIVNDVLSGVPTELSKTLVGGVLERRRNEARELLLSELRKGRSLLQVPDDTVSVLVRYMRAADEGAARVNLRILAKFIAGKAFIGNLKADEFLYYADMIASLRREEIILLATMQRVRKSGTQEDNEQSAEQQWALVVQELVPALFPDESEFRATVTACLRTGLLTDVNTMDDMGWYTTSPLMDELERFASFEIVVAENE